MGSRTVTGIIYHPGGNTPWVGAVAAFELLQIFESGGRTFPVETYTVTTGPGGAFSIALSVPASGSALYRVRISNLRFDVALASGASLTLDELIALQGYPGVAPDGMQTLMDAVLAEIGDMSTLPTTPNNSIVGAIGATALGTTATTISGAIAEDNSRLDAAAVAVNYGGSITTPTPAQALAWAAGGVFNADAYGTGSDDVAIQAAINACTAAGGGVVLLQPKVYTANAFITLKANVTLRGSGPEVTIIKAGNALTTCVIGNSANLWTPGDGNLGICDLTIEANGAHATGAQGLSIANYGGAVANITIRNCRFIHCAGVGVRVAGTNILIDGCYAEDCYVAGFGIGYDVDDPTNTASGHLTSNVRISNCTSCNHNAWAQSSGFKTLGPGRLGWGTLISDVLFSNCNANNIGIAGVAGATGFIAYGGCWWPTAGEPIDQNNPISIMNLHYVNCQTIATSDGAWWINAVTGFSIVGCAADGNAGGTGIRTAAYVIEVQSSYGGLISGTVVRNAAGRGIQIHGGDNGDVNVWHLPCSDILISGCMIDHCGLGQVSPVLPPNSGIHIETHTGYLVTNISVVATTICNNGGNGITVNVGDYLHMAGNHVYNNGASGISVNAGNYIHISGNHIYDNGTVGGNGDAGVLIAGASSNVTIMGNVIRDTRYGAARTQDYGVLASPLPPYSMVYGNQITNNVVGRTNLSAGEEFLRGDNGLELPGCRYNTAAPGDGTGRLGDQVWKTNPSSGTTPGWMCTHSGTFSAATDNTGDTDGSTAVITGMTDTSDFAAGNYVDVSAGFPTTGPYRIVNLTATTMTLDTASNAAASNITVDTSDPVWTAMANLA